MRLKKLNYFREIIVIVLTVLVVAPFGLFWASFKTVDSSDLHGTEVIQGHFDEIGCEENTKRSKRRVKISLNNDQGSSYYGYEMPVLCDGIPIKDVNLYTRVVGITMLELKINGNEYIPLEEGVSRYNLGERLYYLFIISFPLFFIIRPIMKKIGFIRVEWR